MWDTDYAFYLDSPLKHDACSDGIDLSDCFFCEYATGASAARVISKLFRGCLAFKGSRKTEHKPISRARTHGRPPDRLLPKPHTQDQYDRAHGRPPDILLSNSHTSDQHDTSSIIFSCVFVFRIRKIECQLTERELHYNLSRLFMFFNITYLDCSWISILISTIQFEKKKKAVPDLSRNAGIRVALPTERQMTVTFPLAVKTCNPRHSDYDDAFFSDA